MGNVVDYAILLLDHRYLIQEWNIGAVGILGLDDSVRGEPLSIIVAREDAGGADSDLSGRAMQGAPSERWYIGAHGARFWGLSVLTALRNDRGVVAGYVMIIRDLTERKHRDEEREQLIGDLDRANKERERFMAVLAHDLRGYASSIIGWSTLARSGKFETNQPVRHAFEVIERASRQQVELMERMLELARMTSGNFQLTVSTFDVTAVIKKAVDTIRSTAELKHVEVRQSCPPSTMIDGDPDRLLQALLNLLWNALKFTPPNGVIRVACAVEDSFVEIAVSDSGPGIAPDLLPEIFEPFRCGAQVQQAGTGLGLAIVRQIVDLHGGQVRAQNLDREQGSKFTMMVPVSQE
jgi:PAS domain S-box-containing protein